MDPSAGATSYSVLRSTTSGSGYATVATNATTTNYTDIGLSNGTTYYYAVDAVNASRTSANSNEASATPCGVPATPTGLSATAGNATVALSWTASSGATTYRVKRLTTNGGPYTTIASSVTVTNYTDTSVINGTTYYYAVSGGDACAESGNSAQVSATPASGTSSSATIFGSQTPTTYYVGSNPVELGVKFRSDVNGTIIGIRFYKVSGDTSGHTGSLWSSTGTLLATGTFSDETASGWQQLNFSFPVSIAANTTYIASFHTGGSYYYWSYYFQNTGVDNAPLHALQDGVDGPNSIYVSVQGRLPHTHICIDQLLGGCRVRNKVSPVPPLNVNVRGSFQLQESCRMEAASSSTMIRVAPIVFARRHASTVSSSRSARCPR
jgi:hypothetical protein